MPDQTEAAQEDDAPLDGDESRTDQIDRRPEFPAVGNDHEGFLHTKLALIPQQPYRPSAPTPPTPFRTHMAEVIADLLQAMPLDEAKDGQERRHVHEGAQRDAIREPLLEDVGPVAHAHEALVVEALLVVEDLVRAAAALAAPLPLLRVAPRPRLQRLQVLRPARPAPVAVAAVDRGPRHEFPPREHPLQVALPAEVGGRGHADVADVLEEEEAVEDEGALEEADVVSRVGCSWGGELSLRVSDAAVEIGLG
jgi:hypothetical protein